LSLINELKKSHPNTDTSEIPFNKPFITGDETGYINEVINSDCLSGNGKFTKLCQQFFENKYGFNKCLLTSSCTDALEMAAILLNIQSGDEVIVPSYTFVSTANAFVLRGAKIVFVDSGEHDPNMDADKIEKLITTKTKAIVVVHYAGVACEMGKIMEVAKKYGLFVVEDAAQAIDNFYIDADAKHIPLGSIGHLAAFSFHETKNIICGEGGMLVVNDKQFIKRAEIVWEKGTNRSAFYRGEVDKYGWQDIGSSFLMSEITAAFLFGQIQQMDLIQSKRIELWNEYYDLLSPLAAENWFKIPGIPSWSTNNAHIFYLVLNNVEARNKLIAGLKARNIHSVFHYLALHRSDYYLANNPAIQLPNSDRYTDCLLRLPLYGDLKKEQVKFIAESVIDLLSKE
jgi:dTDP-4-amino-4,6-dideoxygalactose transaminase